MIKPLLIYLFLLCGFSAFAETFLLRGKIVDQKRNVVEAAYVEVFDDSTNMLGYALSDSLGLFQVELPVKREYQVHINHISYKPFGGKIIPQEKVISFVLEEHAENIDEVIVTAYTKSMRMNSEGNLVFAPETFGNTITYNLPRLLQTLPNIQISSGGITQNGRPTSLLINGHKRNLSGKSIEVFLKTISINKIKEIIIAPVSSASDLASENGSINIILKKEEDLLATEIGSEINMRKGGVYGNGNAFFMYNKNNFYMDLSLGYYNIYDRRHKNEESSYANSPSTSIFDYYTHSRENDYFGDFNLEWKTERGHKLFATASGFYDEGKNHADNQLRLQPDANRTELTQGTGLLDYDDDLYSLEMEFASNDTLRHQHSVGYGIIWGKAHNNGFTTEMTIAEDTQTETSHNTINRHYGYQHQMKYNYKFLINSNSSLKAGLRIDAGKLNPESQFVEKEQSAEDFLYADRYKLKDNVYAAYSEYTYKNKNTSFSVGLRLEYTDYSALSLYSDKKKYDYKRMDYFPFVSVNQNIGQIATASLQFSSGIDRPHFLSYVPNYRYTSKYAYSIGNPELRPSKFYAATFSTLFLDFLYIGMTYQYTKDILSEITRNEDNSIQKVTTTLNVCDENKLTLQVNCPYVFLNDKISGYLGTWFGYSKYTDLKVDMGHYYNNYYRGFSISNQTQYEAFKDFTIGYDLYYQPKLYTQQHTANPYLRIGFDVSYKIRNVSIGFNVSNIFNERNEGFDLTDQTYTVYRINKYNPTYSFILKYNIKGNTNKRKYRNAIDSSRFK